MNKTTTAIITGASRGLGEALAAQLLTSGISVITVARHANDTLTAIASQHGSVLTQLLADLSDPKQAQTISQDLIRLLPRNLQRCLLINNAGSVQPIANTAKLTDIQAINAALTLNVSSLMLICATLLQAAADRPGIDCRILNISSGAGRNPVSGWGVYCASKAAVDRYTQVLAQEHKHIRAVAIAPGVIDTGMQADIRASDTQDFPNLDQFVALHQKGQLASPEVTAGQIIQYLNRDDFGTTILDDIRNYS